METLRLSRSLPHTFESTTFRQKFIPLRIHSLRLSIIYTPEPSCTSVLTSLPPLVALFVVHVFLDGEKKYGDVNQSKNITDEAMNSFTAEKCYLGDALVSCRVSISLWKNILSCSFYLFSIQALCQKAVPQRGCSGRGGKEGASGARHAQLPEWPFGLGAVWVGCLEGREVAGKERNAWCGRKRLLFAQKWQKKLLFKLFLQFWRCGLRFRQRTSKKLKGKNRFFADLKYK